MPIYEYRCEACEHELEVMQKMADPPLTDCPTCGAATLKKKISPVGFRLKGSGWYETDFKTGNKKKNIAKDDAPPAESKAKDNAKSEGTAKSSEGSKKDAAAA
jgi:putative FmdB family regulatory protein